MPRANSSLSLAGRQLLDHISCWRRVQFSDVPNSHGSRNNDTAPISPTQVCSDTFADSLNMPGMSIDNLDTESDCSYVDRNDFPDDQWMIEARMLFEIRLAGIQFNLLNTVRPSSAPPSIEDVYSSVPDVYRARCGIGKFRSTSWRNVSVASFFGLLGMAATIALKSWETEQGEL